MGSTESGNPSHTGTPSKKAANALSATGHDVIGIAIYWTQRGEVMLEPW